MAKQQNQKKSADEKPTVITCTMTTSDGRTIPLKGTQKKDS